MLLPGCTSGLGYFLTMTILSDLGLSKEDTLKDFQYSEVEVTAHAMGFSLKFKVAKQHSPSQRIALLMASQRELLISMGGLITE